MCTSQCVHLATPTASHVRMMRAVLKELQTCAPRVLAPRPPTVFLLDWDDTCLCTSALEAAGVMADLDAPLAPMFVAALRVLESRVLSLLKTVHALGTLLIVTNAGDGWVELSASRFMPAVRAFLDQHWRSVKIISARAKYAGVFPTNPLQWKARTFADELADIHMKSQVFGVPTSVVVLGDSVGDQYAAHAAVNAIVRGMCLTAASSPISSPPPSPTQLNSSQHDTSGSTIQAESTSSFESSQRVSEAHKQNTMETSKDMDALFAAAQQTIWLKVVKFLERPSAEQLAKELGVLLDHIQAMTLHPASFDVSMYNEADGNSRTVTQQPDGAAPHSVPGQATTKSISQPDEHSVTASGGCEDIVEDSQTVYKSNPSIANACDSFEYPKEHILDSRNEAVVAMEITC